MARYGERRKKMGPRPNVYSARHELFVQHYLADDKLDAISAYIAAGYSAKTASASACKLLAKPHIQAAIREGIEARNKRMEITQDIVLKRLMDLFMANANELAEHRRVPCPDCFPPSDNADPHGTPNPACKICRGNGVAVAHFKDTRNLSPQGAALYAGVKHTPHGPEIVMHNPLAVFPILAKHVGIDKPTLNINLDYDKLTDEQLDHLAKGGSIDTLPK